MSTIALQLDAPRSRRQARPLATKSPSSCADVHLTTLGRRIEALYKRECQILDAPPATDDPEGRKALADADAMYAEATRLSELILANQAISLTGLLAKVMVAKRDIVDPDFLPAEGDGLGPEDDEEAET